MAGNDDCHRITVVGHPDSAECPVSPDCSCDIGVRSSLAVRNSHQSLPAGQLKLSTAEIEREIEVSAPAFEVFVQFPHVRPQSLVGLLEAHPPALGSQVARIGTNCLLSRESAVEFQRDQATLRSRQEQGPDRGSNGCIEESFHACEGLGRSLAITITRLLGSAWPLTECSPWPTVVGCNWVGLRRVKKTLLILAAVALAPVLVVSLLAAGDWRPVGETARGDKVSASAVRVLKKNQRSALIRVEFKEPAIVPQGGPFIEMRARVRVNCTNGQITPSSQWFYIRDRSGRIVVSKKAARDDQFGSEAEGGFREMVSKSLCSQSK
jgi:hypothetical protein